LSPARRRWILPHQAAVSCPGGRWGRRRTRVTECWTILKAEDFYTQLLREDAAKVRPGAAGSAIYTLKAEVYRVEWEVRENSVWRRGRVFWRCPRCRRRCTRVYLPLETSWPACRRCWGLTYSSRKLQNYKDSIWGRGIFAKMFGTSQRDQAYQTTRDCRTQRRALSRRRWTDRRAFLRSKGG
jgi:hypothetical protein